MENDEIAPAQKKQVSEKVMQNLAKANARRKELHEQKKATAQAEKEQNKKLKRVARLKQQLVQLVGEEADEPQENSEPEVEQEMAPSEPVVVVKKTKPPPEPREQTATATPKQVKERAPPKPSAPPQPKIQYC